MSCLECKVNLAGPTGYCPQCVNNRLLRHQIELLESENNRSIRYFSDDTSEWVYTFWKVFAGVAVFSPIFFGDTVVGKIFSFLWMMLWNIVSFPLWLLGKLLG